LAEADYDLLMIQVNSRNNDEWIAEYLNTGRVDGYILITTPPGSIQANTMLELGVPFAAWGAPLPGRNFCSVIGDNFTGGKLAAEHLIRSGRRKLAFLGGPANSSEIQDRYAGFETGLTKAGWPFEQRRIAYGDYSNQSGAVAMRQLLERDPELDAVFVNSDLMATAAIAVLQESGRAVPGDVAVIGYDDLSIARLTTPPLTTISQNLPLAGKMLAQNLVQYLQTGQITSTVLPVELIVRKSG
jgi:DNA-binding LacI/PurR family transcriptional regulator